MTSIAPPSAIKVWTDGCRIFAEVGGYVTAFPLTEGGLSKVLNLLKVRRVDYSGSIVTKVEPETLRQAHAQAILRRMKII